MAHLPIFVDLAGRACIVVGGGRVATQKVRALLETGACVTVIAPEFGAELLELERTWRGAADHGPSAAHLRLERRCYRSGDLDGAMLAFAATGDDAVQAEVVADADRLRVWVNCVDEPERCTFFMPAIARHGSVTLAVGTGGSSPALAGRLRDRASAAMGPEVARAADLLGALRRELPPGPSRARALSRVLDDGLLEAIELGSTARVDELVARARDDVARPVPAPMGSE